MGFLGRNATYPWSVLVPLDTISFDHLLPRGHLLVSDCVLGASGCIRSAGYNIIFGNKSDPYDQLSIHTTELFPLPIVLSALQFCFDSDLLPPHFMHVDFLLSPLKLHLTSS